MSNFEKFYLEDGSYIRYKKSGSGNPLILLHPITNRLEYFDLVTPLLTKNLTVYALDLPGFGDSPVNKNMNYDIVTNIFPRSFPKGQSVEIIRTNILKAHINKMSKLEKEHVTKYFYKNSKNFYIKNFRNKLNNKSIKLAVDSKIDLLKILKKIDKKKFENYSLYD